MQIPHIKSILKVVLEHHFQTEFTISGITVDTESFARTFYGSVANEFERIGEFYSIKIILNPLR